MIDNSDYVLPMVAVEAIKHKFDNTLVGFFVGKRVAFQLVKNYVTNTWENFGFQNVIRDDDGFHFFKFDSCTGVNQVKLHKVHVVAYSEDGLSLIATQIGKPVTLDAFTSDMCVNPWGRIGFARALIEVIAERELQQLKWIWLFLRPSTSKTFINTPLNVLELRNSYDKRMESDDTIVESGLIDGNENTPKENLASLVNEESNNDVEEVYADTKDTEAISKGASTPSMTVLNVYVCAVLESHVDVTSLASVCSRVFRNSDWTSNASYCSMGCRIMVGWNMDVVSLQFIYAGNLQSKRRGLWVDLELHRHVVRDKPWVLMGDFNVALNMEDIYSWSSSMNSAMCDFKEYVKKIKIIDINSSGLHYTWNQKPKGGRGVLKKLDHIMGSLEFVDLFPGSYALFQDFRSFSGYSKDP
ncbi:hypothetical protein Tco_0632470 [Tanacetum coccineum]